MFISSGFLYVLFATTTGAARLITTDHFTPELELDLIEKYKVTFVSNSSFYTQKVIKCPRFNDADLSSIKLWSLGGMFFSSQMKTALSARLKNGHVAVNYGMSEMNDPIAMELPAVIDKDSTGYLTFGAQVKIIDASGNRCGPNEDGEIYIKTNFKCLGYHKDPEANAKLFDEDGFMITGDIGHFDDDGLLFITGRRKEFVRYNQLNVFTSEMNAFLNDSPDIEAACVVGIPDPQHDINELPTAVIVRSEGSNISEKDVYCW